MNDLSLPCVVLAFNHHFLADQQMSTLVTAARPDTFTICLRTPVSQTVDIKHGGLRVVESFSFMIVFTN